MSVAYSISMIVREMIRRKNMLETMAATDMLHCSSHNKIFYQLNINGLSNFKNVTANDLETSYILFLSQLCNIQRTLCRVSWREFHPPLLTEPCLKVSPHTALRT